MKRGLLAAAAAQVESFLLEPAQARAAEPPAEHAPAASCVPLRRPVIAVIGLAPRCGCTAVSRALAAELAARDPASAAAVASPATPGRAPLATPAATRLAGALADLPRASARALGRLCLVGGADGQALVAATRQLAPLVIDAGNVRLDEPPPGLADRVLLVSGPGVQPALPPAAAACLARRGHRAEVVENRAGRSEPPPQLGIALPDSRAGAQLALAGRGAIGELGRAVARLADLCEAGQ